MKVAICISGQMRTYAKCYKSIRRNIIDNFASDVFIHTWENIGKHTLKGESSTIVNKDKILENYKPKRVEIEEFDEKYYYRIGKNHVEKQMIKKDIKGKSYFPMWYKIYKCNELKKQYEKEEGIKYDAVIRLRPDIKITGKLPRSIFSNLEKIWTPKYSIKIKNRVYTNDVFAISNSKNMDIYSSFWNHLPIYLNEINGPERYIYGNEQMLKLFLIEEKKMINKEFYLPYKIIRQNGKLLDKKYIKEKIKLGIFNRKFQI